LPHQAFYLFVATKYQKHEDSMIYLPIALFTVAAVLGVTIQTV